jgi:hypothetical protein
LLVAKGRPILKGQLKQTTTLRSSSFHLDDTGGLLEAEVCLQICSALFAGIHKGFLPSISQVPEPSSLTDGFEMDIF